MWVKFEITIRRYPRVVVPLAPLRLVRLGQARPIFHANFHAILEDPEDRKVSTCSSLVAKIGSLKPNDPVTECRTERGGSKGLNFVDSQFVERGNKRVEKRKFVRERERE